MPITLITKDTLEESNTSYAQGGIAVALVRPTHQNYTTPIQFKLVLVSACLLRLLLWCMKVRTGPGINYLGGPL